MRCFFCDNIPDSGQIAQLGEIDRKHLFKTLRGRVGDQIILLDGRGAQARATIGENQNLIVAGKIIFPANPNAPALFLAIPKRQQMVLLLKQCAELGVGKIYPFISQRTIARAEEISERWPLLLQEGCKQAHNPFLPQIMPIRKLADLLPELANFQSFLGAVRSGITPDKIVSGHLPPAWVVGPEGGFTPGEEAELISGGVTPLRIARYVLRVESAVNGGITILNGAFDNIGEKLPDSGEEWE